MKTIEVSHLELILTLFSLKNDVFLTKNDPDGHENTPEKLRNIEMYMTYLGLYFNTEVLKAFD